MTTLPTSTPSTPDGSFLDSATLEALFGTSAHPMCLLGAADMRFLYVNAAYAALGGVQMLGRHLEEVFPELRESGFIDLLGRVASTGEHALAECVNENETRRFRDYCTTTGSSGTAARSCLGALIQTAVGRAGGSGSLRTNRSGRAACASSRTLARCAVRSTARP